VRLPGLIGGREPADALGLDERDLFLGEAHS
jgi:hypothetical protein